MVYRLFVTLLIFQLIVCAACSQVGNTPLVRSQSMAQNTPTPSKTVDLTVLCNRINEIKILPLRGERGVDVTFDDFMNAGDAVLPCLIEQTTDVTKIRDPRQAPGYEGIEVRTGDIAFLLVLYLKNLRADKFLPNDIKSDYKREGILAYFKYVQVPANRKKLQQSLLKWYNEELK